MTDPNNTQGQSPEEKLLDHNYDGIQEYDNPLPGWWVAIFWGTIVWAFLYFGWYTAGPGDDWFDDLDQKMAVLEEQQATAREEVLSSVGDVSGSASSLVAMMNNADLMKSQEAAWMKHCSVCHTADGRGLVGPNMLDDNYIRVKTIEDIPKIVTEGVLEKGMTPFKGVMTDEEILMISAYVAGMRGKELSEEVATPAKAAEGDVIPPWPAQ